MAPKSREPNRKKSKPGSRRTAKSGGTPAASRKAGAGNPGYAGYEYQISVTVWAALELMLAKERTDALEIEPRSHEDFEAAIRAPENALLHATVATDSFELVVQAKSRSTAPWSSAAFADVLLGRADAGTGGRARPLDLLGQDDSRRYVFVTNEAVDASLRPHSGNHLLDFDDVGDLPPHTRDGIDDARRAALASRMLICPGVTGEVIDGRIRQLLSRHGHVPLPNQDDCIRDLRDDVRARMLGKNGGRWTKTELLDHLVRHGGSIAPTRAMSHYVKPRSYGAILNQLEKHHAVVIAGPSGTGKTLTADILEVDLRRENPPYSVVGEELGPSYVRAQLTRADPLLFHLRDPWGGNRLVPGADRWSGELPKLLREARSDRKFLITSRSDVLRSAGPAISKELAPYTVPIELEDYGADLLGEIYDRIAAGLTGAAREMSARYRQAALAALTRPYEIDRFIVALTREDAANPRNVKDVIAESQIDAISRVIAEQIAPWGDDGVESAAILWGMLSTRAAIATDVLPKVSRRLRKNDPRFTPDVDGLADFLVAGRNLRRDGSALAFHHPRVEDGLRMAFMRRPRVAEAALSRLANALSDFDSDGGDWGVETILALAREVQKVGDLQLDLDAPTQKRLDEHLEALAEAASSRREAYENALRELATFGSETHLPSRLARLLTEGGPRDRRSPLSDFWQSPSVSAAHAKTLRADPRTRQIINNFIRDVLPYTNTHYGSELAEFLVQLTETPQTLTIPFFDALDTVAGPGGPSANISAIVSGACAGAAPDYERAIERFARSEAEADKWFDDFATDMRRAQEHEADALEADHIEEEPGERYYNSQAGMKAVVALRVAREGTGWISGHSHEGLIASALAEHIGESPRPPAAGELQVVLSCANDRVRRRGWQAAGKHWDGTLVPQLERELLRSDLDEGLRTTLVKLAAHSRGALGDPVPLLARIANATQAGRRLEMVRDVMGADLVQDPEGKQGEGERRARAERLADGFAGVERDLGRALIAVVAGDDLGQVAQEINETVCDEAVALLPTLPVSVAGPLSCLVAAAGIDPTATAERLLASGDRHDGETAVWALQIFGAEKTKGTLRQALKHPHFRVRRAALRLLVEVSQPDERQQLAEFAVSDRSADVRLAWANLMQRRCWPEAVDSLLLLLEDTRDFGTDRLHGPAPHWSMFRVGRAAANALGAYSVLSPEQLAKLIACATDTSSRDPFVACAALGALSNKNSERAEATLIGALALPGLEGKSSYRVWAQAAAWALFDRSAADIPLQATGPIIRAACDEAPQIASPLLLAATIIGGDPLKQLLGELRSRTLVSRVELLAAASAPDVVLSSSDQALHIKALCKLAGETPLADLEEDERNAVLQWSGSLSPLVDVEGTTAWVLATHFRLPVRDSEFNPRAYALPQRIPIMTLRSFSSDREEDGSPDDGT